MESSITIGNQFHPLNLYSSEVSAEIAEAVEQNRGLTQALALPLNLNYRLIQL